MSLVLWWGFLGVGQLHFRTVHGVAHVHITTLLQALIDRVFHQIVLLSTFAVITTFAKEVVLKHLLEFINLHGVSPLARC